ncbi:putative domain HDIG [Anaerohalosphaera lusitana]|uniref:Putative domain HDIG n=1 Tax=Anaerohalosphaera lusitana TaxID=1936003 RepID=A0A1U9NII0_9BACT|nr:HDIG domain-containing metalloprotein [Anaerohalosphaera lusitana]AQT67625.1 putative domain HDIG [Anaerohalosphaera lusitana]
MARKKKKISARRQHVRDTISAERLERVSKAVNSPLPAAIAVLVLFIVLATAILSVQTRALDTFFQDMWRPWSQIFSIAALVSIISLGGAMYVHHFKHRIIERAPRAIALATLFLLLLAITRAASFYSEWTYLATGSAITSAVILTIAYDQRFAIGMTTFFCILACFAARADEATTLKLFQLFLTMIAGAVTCCFALREIRTRMKLIEVTTLAAVIVMLVATSLGVLDDWTATKISKTSGAAAAVTVAVGFLIQGFLPLIERAFGIATSMTLLDYSDANQPLLKKLAMEAPGTFSHSLLIGSIAESAADSINANGLLCRVGAYYHDIGKINKPPYFVENQMGSASRHEALSPAMSQLVIVGHVKDGIEIAREYGLPAVLRQFIETHHGTTLIEYFYNEAKKQADEKGTTISDTEFRYPGPKPHSKEAAIVMLSDTCESAVRSLGDVSPTRIEAVVHNMAMKRLQDGQFDECDLTLRELSTIEETLSKSLAAHHHGRIKYPTPPDEPQKENG